MSSSTSCSSDSDDLLAVIRAKVTATISDLKKDFVAEMQKTPTEEEVREWNEGAGKDYVCTLCVQDPDALFGCEPSVKGGIQGITCSKCEARLGQCQPGVNMQLCSRADEERRFRVKRVLIIDDEAFRILKGVCFPAARDGVIVREKQAESMDGSMNTVEGSKQSCIKSVPSNARASDMNTKMSGKEKAKTVASASQTDKQYQRPHLSSLGYRPRQPSENRLQYIPSIRTLANPYPKRKPAPPARLKAKTNKNKNKETETNTNDDSGNHMTKTTVNTISNEVTTSNSDEMRPSATDSKSGMDSELELEYPEEGVPVSNGTDHTTASTYTTTTATDTATKMLSPTQVQSEGPPRFRPRKTALDTSSTSAASTASASSCLPPMPPVHVHPPPAQLASTTTTPGSVSNLLNLPSAPLKSSGATPSNAKAIATKAVTTTTAINNNTTRSRTRVPCPPAPPLPRLYLPPVPPPPSFAGKTSNSESSPIMTTTAAAAEAEATTYPLKLNFQYPNVIPGRGGFAEISSGRGIEGVTCGSKVSTSCGAASGSGFGVENGVGKTSGLPVYRPHPHVHAHAHAFGPWNHSPDAPSSPASPHSQSSVLMCSKNPVFGVNTAGARAGHQSASKTPASVLTPTSASTPVSSGLNHDLLRSTSVLDVAASVSASHSDSMPVSGFSSISSQYSAISTQKHALHSPASDMYAPSSATPHPSTGTALTTVDASSESVSALAETPRDTELQTGQRNERNEEERLRKKIRLSDKGPARADTSMMSGTLKDSRSLNDTSSPMTFSNHSPVEVFDTSTLVNDLDPMDLDRALGARGLLQLGELGQAGDRSASRTDHPYSFHLSGSHSYNRSAAVLRDMDRAKGKGEQARLNTNQMDAWDRSDKENASALSAHESQVRQELVRLTVLKEDLKNRLRRTTTELGETKEELELERTRERERRVLDMKKKEREERDRLKLSETNALRIRSHQARIAEHANLSILDRGLARAIDVFEEQSRKEDVHSRGQAKQAIIISLETLAEELASVADRRLEGLPFGFGAIMGIMRDGGRQVDGPVS